MKKDYRIIHKIGAASVVLGLLMPTLVLAEENGNKGRASTTAETRTATSSKIKDKLEELRNKAEEKKGQIQEKREETKEKIEAKREDVKSKLVARFSEFMGKVMERLNAAVKRLEKIASRLESRIAKLEAEGGDEAKAKELLVTAKTKINIAKVSISQVQVSASSTLASTTDLKYNYGFNKDAVEKAKSDLKAAHAALVDVIKNIKPGRNKPHATSTPETSTSTATTTP